MADQISEHEIRIFDVLQTQGRWMTAREVAAQADVADRTARLHVATMTNIGLLECLKVFGGYRYRVAAAPAEKAKEYLGRLSEARAAYSG